MLYDDEGQVSRWVASAALVLLRMATCLCLPAPVCETGSIVTREIEQLLVVLPMITIVTATRDSKMGRRRC